MFILGGGSVSKTTKKLIIIESICFFVGWIIIFLLGADKPPPVGFWNIVVLLIVLDIIQGYYLSYLLRNIMVRPTFIKNIFLFFLAGIIVSGITAITSGTYDLINVFIWIGLVTTVSVLYGFFFWVINWWIAKKKARNNIVS